MNVGVRIFCGTVKATVQPDRDEMADRAVTMRNRSGKDPQRDVDRSRGHSSNLCPSYAPHFQSYARYDVRSLVSGAPQGRKLQYNAS